MASLALASSSPVGSCMDNDNNNNDKVQQIIKKSAKAQATEEITYFLTSGLAFHFVFFLMILYFLLKAILKEVKRARDSWAISVYGEAEIGGVFTQAYGSNGDGEGPDFSTLQLGSPVVHPNWGRGDVVSFDMRGGVVVHYDETDEKRLHIAEEKSDLLQIGMKVNHPQRGLGRVKKFDEQGRVHVEFENGEYHRYKHEAWKSKITGNKNNKTKASSKALMNLFVWDYIFYRLDYILSHYPFAKPALLMLCVYFLILMGAMAFSLTSTISFGEALWKAWTMVADPGTHSDETQTLQRAIALILTVGGMLVFALMISIIADGVSSLLDGLKQGNSSVIESGHTLILGWSDKTVPLIKEIALANESCNGGVVVVLADKPKSEMEKELQREFHTLEDSRGTTVICRSGTTTNQSDLRKVSATAAKSIIVLATTHDADEADANSVRVVMSLTGIRSSRMGHVVVEMCDVDNRDLVLLVDNSHVEVVVAHDLIGRLMIQCARQPGLASILEEILGFEGDEFYLKSFPELQGKTFGEALYKFKDAIPMGVKPKDRKVAFEQLLNSAWRKESLKRRGFDGQIKQEVGGKEEDFSMKADNLAQVIDHFAMDSSHSPSMAQQLQRRDDTEDLISREVVMNPPNDYVFQPGDELLVLAEDDDSYGYNEFEDAAEDRAVCFQTMEQAHRPAVQNHPEKFLFCGWRRDMDDMIWELDKLVGPQSDLTIMSLVPIAEREARLISGGLDVSRLKNIKIEHVVGNPILRRDLDKLKLQHYSSILILADQDLERNVSSADSKSLASLLVIRDMIAKRNLAQPSTYPTLQRKQSTEQAVMGDATSAARKSSSLSLDTSSPMLGQSAKHPSPIGATSPSGVGSNNKTARPRLVSQNSDKRVISFEDEIPLLSQSSEPIISPNSTLQQMNSTASKPKLLKQVSATSESLLNGIKKNSSPSDRSLLLGLTGSSSLSLNQKWKPNSLARRPSSVGADLYFENTQGIGQTVIISEILDSKTKALIPIARVSDHIMSNEIVASALAMVSEDRSINVVLNEILQADGNDLHIRSSLDYVGPTERIHFWELLKRARARGEIALGYRLTGEKQQVLNPRDKNAKFVLGARGTVFVIAED